MIITEDKIVNPISKKIAVRFVEKYYPEYLNEKIEYAGGGSFSVYTIGNKLILRLSKSCSNPDDIKKSFYSEKKLINEIRDFVKPHTLPEHEKIIVDHSIFQGAGWFTKQAVGQTLKILLNDTNKKEVAKSLADFLSKLHSIDPKQIISHQFKKVTSDEIIESWYRSYEENKKKYFQLLTVHERKYMDNVYQMFLKKAHKMKPMQCLTHGDFDPTNCIWNPNQKYLQVIDCEDLGLGQAAGDFCTWYGYYGENFLDQILENYQIKFDILFKERIKFYWLRIPLVYFGYADQYKNKSFITFGKQLLNKNMENFVLKYS